MHRPYLTSPATLQNIHVDDDKDNVPGAGSRKGGATAVTIELAETAADGVERQLASVSGIMSSADFESLNLTPNTQKVSRESGLRRRPV
jgi:hypothetical protein